MTLKEFYDLFATGQLIPIAYRFFPEESGQHLPFCVYYEEETNNYAADGVAFYGHKKVILELYSKNKDLASEAMIENVLKTAGLFWNAYDVYNNDEKCNERIYSINL